MLSVAIPEPRFTAADKAVLLASRRDEHNRGSHGLPLSVSTDPKNQFAFQVPPPITDHAELALAKAKSEYLKKYPDAVSSALVWRVEKRD